MSSNVVIELPDSLMHFRVINAILQLFFGVYVGRTATAFLFPRRIDLWENARLYIISKYDILFTLLY